MHAALTLLLDRLDGLASRTQVLGWGSPVPCFGDPTVARVASLGLNPSNREFLDEAGRELDGPLRRFHTLRSLGIRNWAETDARHLNLIINSCQAYFLGNPYDRWFKTLDALLEETGSSYYGGANPACHLDLIPYATRRKWGDLGARQRSVLLTAAADALGRLLQESQIRVLVLNGQTVVDNFAAVAAINLVSRRMRRWALPRRSGNDVEGVAYWGVADAVADVQLGRDILVLGFNHNLQSSYGVTRRARTAISAWIGAAMRDMP